MNAMSTRPACALRKPRIRSLDINPLTMPALFLRTSERGSFAEHTFKVRIPKIVREVLATQAYGSETTLALEALLGEIGHGRIRGLAEDAPDRAFWDAVTSPIWGRSWFDAPYFLAETFFYRRLLEATGYFRAGKGAERDPFAPQKLAELSYARSSLDAFLRVLPDQPGERLACLVQGCLFGNRADLSHEASKSFARRAAEASDLVVDHSDALLAHLGSGRVEKLVYIADNAATELATDLALIDHLLDRGLVRRVELHVKPHPVFVSDAMAADVVSAIAALAESEGALGALGSRLVGHIADGQLETRTHWFYSSSLFYAEMPEDLARDLASANLVLLKGDVNYRRLLCDLKWPYTTDFSAVTVNFPAPLAALRVMQAELVAGLSPGQAERLAAEDPLWLVNGRRAVLQANISHRIAWR